MRIAYADPPYPGKSHLYREHPDYAGEVDHRALVLSLAGYDGWALSTDSPALRYVLSLCPLDVQVAAWVRTNAPPFNPDGRGSVRSWEPVIYRPAREHVNAADRVRDVLSCAAPTGTLGVGITGAKPPAFAAWVFSLLAAEPSDTLDDLFPGSGGIGRAWDDWTRQPSLFGRALGGPRSGEYRAPGQLRMEGVA